MLFAWLRGLVGQPGAQDNACMLLAPGCPYDPMAGDLWLHLGAKIRLQKFKSTARTLSRRLPHHTIKPF